MNADPDQPEFDLDLPLTRSEHRREGEGGTRERKEPDPDRIVWRRVHTTEKCHTCIEAVRDALAAGESARAAWPASYVRTERDRREALCFEHAAPRRQAEGLRKQRSNDPNAPVKPKR